MKKIFYGAIASTLVAVFALAVMPVFAANNNDMGSITGGGNITQTDWEGNVVARISFAGNAGFDKDGNPTGNWQAILHDVFGEQFDKAKFKATEITNISFGNLWWCPDADQPESDKNYAEIRMKGTLNGEDGWGMIVKMTDFGEAGINNDTIRMSLYKPGNPWWKNYDTAFGFYDWPNDFWCSYMRTKIDGGNLQIHMPEPKNEPMPE